MDRKEKAKQVLTLLSKSIKNPRTELVFHTPWQMLVAVVLSAQSTDKQVNKITARLFENFPGPADIAVLEPEELAEHIKGVGLFRNKSRHLVEAARIIMEEFDGQVPADFESLARLPGVGRKSANVILSNAFGVPALAVDTHVFRVANRIGLASAKTPLMVEKQLTEIIPREQWSVAHHLLILHGRYVCTARKPKCETCVVSSCCSHYAGDKEEGGS